MNNIKKLNELKDQKLLEIGQSTNRLKILYNTEARNYAKKNKIKRHRSRGYIDIDSYFLSPKEPIVVLIYKTKDKFVYGTIAHELEHAKQLLEGRILQNNNRGKFKCECDAYKAGKKEMEKQSKWKSILYRIDSWGSIVGYFLKYEIWSRIKRTNRASTKF